MLVDLEIGGLVSWIWVLMMAIPGCLVLAWLRWTRLIAMPQILVAT